MTAPGLENPDYLGALDDVVRRHPWDVPITRDTLDHLLTTQLLFGGVGLINDGYLANSPVLLQALLDPDSLLVRMLAAGLISILSTGPQPSASILGRAAGGVREHHELVTSDRWPKIAELLDSVATGPDRPRVSGWPSRDLTTGFRAIVDRLIASLRTGRPLTAAPLHEAVNFLQRLSAALGEDPFAPRTKWEMILTDALETADIDARCRTPMMRLANSIYHLNFTMNLALDCLAPVNATTWYNADTLLLLDAAGWPVRHSSFGMRGPRIAKSNAPWLLESITGDTRLAKAKTQFLANAGDVTAQRNYLRLLRAFSMSESDPVITMPDFVYPDVVHRELRIMTWRPRRPLHAIQTLKPGFVKIVLTKKLSQPIVGF